MKKKLLLVDDEKTFLIGLKEWLDEFKSDFMTDICFSVDSAIKLQKKEKYDLIVSDIRMPKKSGLDLFVHLKNSKFKGGFIAMTAYGTEELLKNVRDLGGLDVIFKPFDIVWFKDKIINYFSEEGVSGVIDSIDLTSLLQMINLEKKSITVKIKNNKGVGLLYFDRGEIIHAEYGRLEGVAAVKEIILMNKGKFSFVKNGEEIHRTIDISFISLMIDSAKTNDEINNKGKINFKEEKMNSEKLSKVVEIPKKEMGEGLVACDIFSATDGQVLAGVNSQAAASALFNRVSDFLIESLDGAGFPAMDKYYMVNLVDNKMVVVMLFGEYRWGILLDLKKVQLGMLFNVIMPKMRKALEEVIAEE